MFPLLVCEGGSLQKVGKIYNMVGVSFKEFVVECGNVFYRKGIKKALGGGGGGVGVGWGWGVVVAFETREYWPRNVNEWGSGQSLNAAQYLCKNGRDEGYLF
jgi:hypothetical protein